MSKEKIKVLVVDDSLLIRKAVGLALAKEPDIEVVDTAVDAFDARDKIAKLKPDVITLDIDMPKMDGLTFLKIIMSQQPMPVIVMSAFTQEGSEVAYDALHAGAFSVIGKPAPGANVSESIRQLISEVKAAGQANVGNINKKSARVSSEKRKTGTQIHSPKKVVLLGASTGGTEALKEVLVRLPKNMPGICVVQHIPANFSRTFADRLNEMCELDVKEARHGDIVEPGHVLIAPGGYHMTLHWSNGRYKVQLNEAPKVWHQRPAVDILFKTGAECAGKHAVSALLTGMGKDGAEGMLSLKEKGAKTMAQSEETCVVYGMPRAAYEIGAAQKMVPLLDIPEMIQEGLSN